jgi:hypothetical protein
LLDIFKSDAFGVTTLTAAINILPVSSNVLGSLGLFKEEGVATTSVALEFSSGRITLILNQPRGIMPEYEKHTKRKVRDFRLPHLPMNNNVYAEEVQNLREFGSNDSLASVSSLVNQRMADLKQDHEMTWEYHRAGALSGVLYDGDGSSVLYNFFTEFGVTETSVTFTMATTNSVRTGCLAIQQAMDDALGAQTYTGIMAICNPVFFDAFVNSVDVKAAWDKWQDGQFLRQNARTEFDYGGIKWVRYTGKLGATPFIASGNARFVPMGVPGLFRRFNGPATFIEAVNTIGKPMYAKQMNLPFDTGVVLHTQSNPLHICTQPAVLVKGVAA